MEKILIVEDDELLNYGLCYHLQKNGYNPVPAYTLEQARNLIDTEKMEKAKTAEKTWALFLLDIHFPDGDGLRFAKELRQKSAAPIIFLTAQDMDEDMIRGFEAGADDYITKPFNIKILMQRVQAVLKRYQISLEKASQVSISSAPAFATTASTASVSSTGTSAELPSPSVSFGDLEVNFETMTAKKHGVPLLLTPTEWKLLVIFCRHPGQILTRQLLLERLWDQDGNFVDEHTLTINISRLRKKIEDGSDTYIKTVYGMGYQWMVTAH